MKKRLFLAVILIVLLLAGNSMATPIPIFEGQTVNVKRDNSIFPFGTDGGPFIITGSGFEFATFCIEITEYINVPRDYVVDDISRIVISGATPSLSKPNLLTGGHQLSYGAANLYSQWLDYADKTKQNVNDAYQKGIWYFEEQGAALTDEEKKLIYSWSAAEGATDWGGVYALNLEYPNGYLAQSMLVRNPVPEPVSMLLFGTGLVGVGGYVRRKFKK